MMRPFQYGRSQHVPRNEQGDADSNGVCACAFTISFLVLLEAVMLTLFAQNNDLQIHHWEITVIVLVNVVVAAVLVIRIRRFYRKKTNSANEQTEAHVNVTNNLHVYSITGTTCILNNRMAGGSHDLHVSCPVCSLPTYSEAVQPPPSYDEIVIETSHL